MDKTAVAMFGLLLLFITPIFLFTELEPALWIVGGIVCYAVLSTLPSYIISTIEMKRRWKDEDLKSGIKNT